MIIVGGDPGGNGAVCIISDGDAETFSLGGKHGTFYDLEDWCDIQLRSGVDKVVTYVEFVHGRRGDYVNRTFTFGSNTGKMLHILGRYSELKNVNSDDWKRFHGLGGIKDYDEGKRRAKEKAQALYPNVKVTLTNADSILIARYGLAQEMDV